MQAKITQNIEPGQIQSLLKDEINGIKNGFATQETSIIKNHSNGNHSLTIDIKNVLQNVFIPTWTNKPVPIPDVLSLAGTPILGHQNSSAIIALPGHGKSSIIEAVSASYLNPHADSLGFSVDQSCEGIIIIDNE